MSEKFLVPSYVEKVLGWRSYDFGHDCQKLLEAESVALQEVGENYLRLYSAYESAIKAGQLLAESEDAALRKVQDWKDSFAEARAEINRLREGLQRIVDEGIDTSTDGGMSFVKELLGSIIESRKKD